jgi:hypothetical protein
MNRKELIKLSALGALMTAFPRFSLSQNQQRPNVLFIAIDDLNDWLGRLGGHPDVKTPNLDRLVEKKCTFYQCPLCVFHLQSLAYQRSYWDTPIDLRSL